MRKQGDYVCEDQNGDFLLGRKVRTNAEEHNLGNVPFVNLEVVYVYIRFIIIL